MRTFAATALTPPPYEALVHRAVGEITAHTAEWADAFGLAPTEAARERLSRANAAELAARACPEVPVAAARLVADLLTWLFAFDDRCDEDAMGTDPGRLAPALAPLLEVVDRFGTAAHADYQPAGPTAAALHDLCRRIRALGRPGGLLRFSAAFREYLFALLWEATNRQLHRVPRFAEYVQMRRHTGAVLPSFALTDLATDGLAAPADRVDPRVVRLDLLAADLVCWCNDVFSYGKERLRDGHNLATVIAHELSWPERAALTEAAARYNAGLAAYRSLEAEVLAEADTRLSRMLLARRRWLRGTYDWSLSASRYS
ncbi:terpene synthase [Asanoa sp. NPDC050611]|uniref:terpene synthase family protein n=1 Tax=Asanoa sp. NPDC050611 TaxID=3157098 RepID=UPI0033C9A12F